MVTPWPAWSDMMVLDRQQLPELIRTSILESMMSGELKPGERLVEMKLAARFGVSQAPVREALRDLEAVGLVTKHANRGTFVGDFGDSAMHDIFVVRSGLEELATRLATPLLARRTEVLQAEVDAMVDAALRNDGAAVSFHSHSFHALIVDAAANPILSRMWRSLNIETHTQVAVILQTDLVALAESHQLIVDPIAKGDVEAACVAAREHQDELDKITPRVT